MIKAGVSRSGVAQSGVRRQLRGFGECVARRITPTEPMSAATDAALALLGCSWPAALANLDISDWEAIEAILDALVERRNG
jgi:hypothetical protein